MDSQRMFGSTVNLLEQALDLRARKHRMVTSNIANIDTPNYKGFDLVMGQARESARRLPLHTTHSEHQGQTGAAGSIAHEAKPTRSSVKRVDGNTVDLDQAMTSLTENHLMYTVTAQLTAQKLRALGSAIKGGN